MGITDKQVVLEARYDWQLSHPPPEHFCKSGISKAPHPDGESNQDLDLPATIADYVLSFPWKASCLSTRPRRSAPGGLRSTLGAVCLLVARLRNEFLFVLRLRKHLESVTKPFRFSTASEICQLQVTAVGGGHPSSEHLTITAGLAPKECGFAVPSSPGLSCFRQ